MNAPLRLRPVAAELAAIDDEHRRRVELETIPAGYRPLSPWWRPDDDQALADRIALELRRVVR